ncbi:hypothetical protein ACFU5C_37320, partial [Streptomyces sp. NPDC057426]
RLVDENGLASVNKDFQEILNDGTLERVLSQTESTLKELLPPELSSPVVDTPENVVADTPEPAVDTPEPAVETLEPVVETLEPAVERQAGTARPARSGDAGGESGAGPLIVAQREGARAPEAVLENVVRRNVQEAVVQWMLFSPELVRLAEKTTLGEAIASAPPGAEGAMREWGSWVTGNVSPEVWNAVDPQTRAGIRETLLTEKLATLAVNDFVLAENQITWVEDVATPVTSEVLPPPVTSEVLPPAASEAVPPVASEAVPPAVSEVLPPAASEVPSPAVSDVVAPVVSDAVAPVVSERVGAVSEQSGIPPVEGRRMGEAGAPDEVRMMTAIVKSVESLGEL